MLVSGPVQVAPARETVASGLVLRDIIGEGGSGTVYAATKEGRELAVKLLRADVAQTAREQRRFVDEAERMRRVRHPGLVALVDSGVMPDGRPFIAMPRLYGETLGHRLQRGPIPLPRALAMFEVLAGAVHALHSAGLIHRDIKPENIFLEVDRATLGVAATGKVPAAGPDRDVDAFCRPVLLDLGIAQEQEGGASTTTLGGQTRGTPAYMAPERFFGASATTRSDIYELAVTLYAMLVGHLPWREPQGADRLAPLDPAERGVALPPGITHAILGALSTRPEARPRTVQAFAAAVAASATEGEPEHRTTAPLATSYPPPAAATPAAVETVSGAPTGSFSRGGGLLAVLALALGLGAVVLVGSRPPLATSASAPRVPASETTPPPMAAPVVLPPTWVSPPDVPLPKAPAAAEERRPRPVTHPAASTTPAKAALPPVSPAPRGAVDPYDHM
jgi:serine/threonine-protein kinase